MTTFVWTVSEEAVDWVELSKLYRLAPLGEKPPASLRTVFSNSMFKCFVYSDGRLIGAGRAIADGLDCAYLADVAVHPDHQGRGWARPSSATWAAWPKTTRRSSSTPTPEPKTSPWASSQ